jgi:SMI1-KNR4 cell-wall
MKEDKDLLLAASPPPAVPVDPGAPDGWIAVEHQLGVDLPRDYKWLINTYGSGDFCDLLVVLNPFSPRGSMSLLAQVSPILEQHRLGGLFNRTFPCFPEEGGLLPVAQDTNGGSLFWLTRGLPDEWQLVLYDYDNHQQYPLGLAKFLARWIAGFMPESFFGNGNNTGIIRRDPVFCPAGQVRPPQPTMPLTSIDEPCGRVGNLSLLSRGATAETSEEAIAWFNAQGYFAWAMDLFSPGALFAATSARTDKTGANWLQGALVAVFPKGGAWTVAPLPDMGMGPQFEPMSFQSLDEAVMAARDLIHGDTSDPAEKARIRVEARIGKKIWDPDVRQ